MQQAYRSTAAGEKADPQLTRARKTSELLIKALGLPWRERDRAVPMGYSFRNCEEEEVNECLVIHFIYPDLMFSEAETRQRKILRVDSLYQRMLEDHGFSPLLLRRKYVSYRDDRRSPALVTTFDELFAWDARHRAAKAAEAAEATKARR